MAELTPTQKSQLEGIQKFLGGKELIPAGSRPVEGNPHLETHQFRVKDMPNATVETWTTPGGASDGKDFTGSGLTVQTPQGEQINRVYNDGETGRHSTEHHRPDGTHAEIRNGVAKPIMDADPDKYSPPSAEEERFHDVTKPASTPAPAEKKAARMTFNA